MQGRDDLLLKLLKKYYSTKKNGRDTNSDKKYYNLNITDLENGYNCLHYAVFYANFSCIKLLLQTDLIDNKTKDELQNTKDREGLTPLNLLHSMCDYKSFRQIPDSIGLENDHYNNSVIGFNTINRFDLIKKDDAKTDNDTPATPVPEKNYTNSMYNSKWWNELRGAAELFMFGSNMNNNLGCGDSEDRMTAPVKIKSKSFRVDNNGIANTLSERFFEPRIKDINISRFHTMVVTTDQTNNIFVAGSNKLGRLGLGTNDISPKFSFEPVKYFDNIHIERIAISDDHTLALDSNGRVYSWGSNEFSQLGYSEEVSSKNPFNSTPTRLNYAEFMRNRILGISCSKIHSVAYSRETAYVWGLNIGQFGVQSVGETVRYKTHRDAVIQESPIKIGFSYGFIKHVLCLEHATLILTSETNDIHVYINAFHAKISPPLLLNQFNNKRVDNFDLFEFKAAGSKRKITKIVGKGKIVGLLYDNGYVLSFSLDDSFSTYSDLLKSINFNVIWNPKRQGMMAIDVDISEDGSIILSTNEGTVFKKTGSGSKSSKDSKPSKVNKVDRVVKVCCDPFFVTFGFLRDDVDTIPVRLPKSEFYKDIHELSPITVKLDEKTLSDLHNELLKENPQIDSYFTNFLFQRQKIIKHNDHDGLDIILDNQKETLDSQHAHYISNHKDDNLYKKYMDRWYGREAFKSKIYDNNLAKLTDIQLLQADSLIQTSQDDSGIGAFDWRFIVGSYSIIVNADILASRSSILLDLFTKSTSTGAGNISIISNVAKRTVTFYGIETKSLLVVLHFIYTDEVISLWSDYPIISLAPESIQDLRKRILNLGRILKIVNVLDKFQCEQNLVDGLLSLATDLKFSSLLDTVIKLVDGEVLSSSALLKQRSIFFKHCLSERWTDSRHKRTICLEHITKDQFILILKYLYGANPLQLLDSQDGLNERHDVINFALDLIEICDELLLLELKDYFQFFICEFISSENVAPLISFSSMLNAKKVFEECCWYIFNNLLDVLVNNGPVSTKFLDQGISHKIDRYFKFFYRLRTNAPVNHDVSVFKVKNSAQILFNFLFDTKTHNEFYMSGEKKFEPLVEQKLNKLPNKLPKIRLSTSERQRRKSSLDNPINVIGAESKALKNNIILGFKGKEFADNNDFAIDDNDDDNDDFVTVSNARRRKSSLKNAPRMFSSISEADKPPAPFSTSTSISTSASSARIDISDCTRISGSSASPPPLPPSASSSFGSATSSQLKTEARTSKNQYLWPTLMDNVEKKPVEKIAKPAEFSKSKNRSVLASTSKRSTASAPTAKRNGINIFETDLLKEKSSTPSNPWARSTNTSASSSSSNLTQSTISGTQPSNGLYRLGAKKTEEFPTLGELSLTKEDTGSLAAIMLKEKLKKEQAKEREMNQKTLAEIQQEEEFNKWFEEEARRVQQQLGLVDESSKRKTISQKKKQQPNKQLGNRKLSNLNKKSPVKKEKLSKGETPSSSDKIDGSNKKKDSRNKPQSKPINDNKGKDKLPSGSNNGNLTRSNKKGKEKLKLLDQNGNSSQSKPANGASQHHDKGSNAITNANANGNQRPKDYTNLSSLQSQAKKSGKTKIGQY